MRCCSWSAACCCLPRAGSATDPHAALRTAALLVVVAVLHTELGRDAERVRRSTARWRAARQHGVGLVLRGGRAAVAGLGRALRGRRARAPVVALGRAAGAAVPAGVHHGGVRAGHGGGLGGDDLAARRACPPGSACSCSRPGCWSFFTVNTALVAGAMAVAGPPSGAAQAVGTADENLLEIATLCVGALVAAVMVVNPWLVLLAGAAAARAPARRPRAAPGAGGEHRREDRPAQRGRVARAGRARGHPTRPRRRRRRRCSCSTSTTSRTSTTPTATSRATRCWPRWPMRCGPRCATATSSAGSAARSS